MTYRFIQTAKPSTEPVTLSEAKAHLRLETTADDTFITTLIETARQICENFTKTAFMKQTFSVFMDAFPKSGIVKVPRLPFLTLLAINAYDADDVAESQNLDAIAAIRDGSL